MKIFSENLKMKILLKVNHMPGRHEEMLFTEKGRAYLKKGGAFSKTRRKKGGAFSVWTQQDGVALRLDNCDFFKEVRNDVYVSSRI